MQQSRVIWASSGSLFSNLSRRNFCNSFITYVVSVTQNRVVQNRIPMDVPQPKFWFGQHVKCEYECDDTLSADYGMILCDYGLVIGLGYDIPGYYCGGWTYWVDWYYLTYPTVKLPHTGLALEDELTLI